MYYNSFKFGLYKVILKTNHALFNYKIDKSQWLSHHDLKAAEMLGVNVKIDENGINFLNYDPKKCVSGFSVFKDYFDKCNEFVSKCKSNEVVKKNNVFKYNFARVCFITSFCRLKMLETILECGLDNIAYINTDGFASLIEQPSLKISENNGDWSMKKYSKCVVNNSNSVIFTCGVCGLIKKDCKC
jgi:hypothetical protein